MMLRDLPAAFVLLLVAGRTCAGPVDLETDCNKPSNTTNHPAVLPSPNSFQFRADLFTPGECSIYARSLPSCSPVVGRSRCSGTATDQTLDHPLGRTYVVLDQGCYSAERSVVLEATSRIRPVSRNRALIMTITERNDAKDPIHSDVFEPIRNQLIDLVIKKCVTVTVTSKIREVGVLTNLFKLEIQRGKSLVIEKQDFANMPNVRMISFWLSTIMYLEPYTFTDLTQLDSLLLEDGIHKHLMDIFNNTKFSAMETHLFNSDDVEAVQRLHCNCSFAWLRNFLKEKPYLIEGKKRGEVTIVGNYVSREVEVPPATMSVDCAVAYMNETNLSVDSEFSYNTVCYNLQC